MLFTIKIALYAIPKFAPHFNLFHIEYKNIRGEIISRSKTTVVAEAPFKSNPKNEISLSGIVIDTAIDIITHKNKTIDRIFKDNGKDFQLFIWCALFPSQGFSFRTLDT